MNEQQEAEVVRELRWLAERGESLVVMLRYLMTQFPGDGAGRGLRPVVLVRKYTGLPLGMMIWIAGWEGWGSGNPGLSDEEVERKYGELVRAGLLKGTAEAPPELGSGPWPKIPTLSNTP